MFVIGDFIRGLETIVEQDLVDEVKRKLLQNANTLDRGRFQDLHVSGAVFGGSPKGVELGTHHGRAHQVISETIEGVVSDMRAFRDGVIAAETMLGDADEGARADLTRSEAAVRALGDATQSFQGDRNYDTARNHHTGSTT